MSETTQNSSEEIQPPVIPNYATTRKVVNFNGEPEDRMEVRFGINPTDPSLPSMAVEIRKTDMGDTFELMEVAGNQVDNDIWLSLAVVAMSVRMIDGAPIPSGAVSKERLKKTLKVIGPTGVRAVRRALGEFDATASPVSSKVAAGN